MLLQFVPDDLKDEKYWARRRKNNMAAKRSRDARRVKENQIALRAGFLEKEVMTHLTLFILILYSCFTVNKLYSFLKYTSYKNIITLYG